MLSHLFLKQVYGNTSLYFFSFKDHIISLRTSKQRKPAVFIYEMYTMFICRENPYWNQPSCQHLGPLFSKTFTLIIFHFHISSNQSNTERKLVACTNTASKITSKSSCDRSAAEHQDSITEICKFMVPQARTGIWPKEITGTDFYHRSLGM